MSRSKPGWVVPWHRNSRGRRPPIAPFAVMLLAVLTTAPAIGCETPMLPQRSIEAVILVLSDCHLDRSVQQDREYIAPILQTARGFVGVVTAGEPGHDRFRLRITTSTGERLVALWHTHGESGHAREWFSAADTRLANRLGLPSYLTTPGGETRVYLPGEPTPIVRDEFRRVMPLGVAVGRVVRLGPAAGIADRVDSTLRDLEIASIEQTVGASSSSRIPGVGGEGYPPSSSSQIPGVGGEGYPPSSSSRSGDRSHEESRPGDRSYTRAPGAVAVTAR